MMDTKTDSMAEKQSSELAMMNPQESSSYREPLNLLNNFKKNIDSAY